MRPYSKGIIEIAPFAIDERYHRNYINDLNFAEYVLSTGNCISENYNIFYYYLIFIGCMTFLINN